MTRRYELHDILCDLLGSNSVYFQPPENIKMTYPAIVYELAGDRTDYADNLQYRQQRKYTVTIIDKNPDSDIFERFKNPFANPLDYCIFDRPFRSANLNHFVFTVYY